jgi:hypothetical protein
MIDLAEGNVFVTKTGCHCSSHVSCNALPKLAFVVDDNWEVTTQPTQTGQSLRDLIGVSEHLHLLRDFESPCDQTISNDDSIEFADGPVFITRCDETQSITIIVNARPKEVNYSTITLAQVVILAFGEMQDDPKVLYTATYSHGPKENPEGELSLGKTIKLKERMVFCVTRTDKS